VKGRKQLQTQKYSLKRPRPMRLYDHLFVGMWKQDR